MPKTSRKSIRTATLGGLCAAFTVTPALAIELPADAPAIPAPAPVPDTGATTPTIAAPIQARSVPSALRLGARGPSVVLLQRELRRRGLRVRADGAYGPATRRAVMTLQRRLRLRATGVADARLLRRLGIQMTTPAALTQPAGASGTMTAFPVAGPHDYIDSWGAPRSQGGHEGADIMAARNTPLVAVTDAVVDELSPTESGLGGIHLWLRDASGNRYYYAHMQSVEPILREGSRVAAGQVIGGVGNSGDARGGPTHVHFEIHPGGRGAVNPYGRLVAVDAGHTPGR